MIKTTTNAIILTALLCGLGQQFQATLRGAAPVDEGQLVAVLQSNASPQQKDAACAQLKRVGTARSVPALAALLKDEQLSHSARFALESMAAPEAGAALTTALDTTTGLTQAGIAQSLGMRRETQAVPALAKLLADSDGSVVAAAAFALGKISGPQAVQALQRALPASRKGAHGVIVDALLMCANQALADGDRGAAGKIFQQLHAVPEPDHIRTAAYRGMIRSAGNRALSLVTEAIQGNDAPSQMAALQMAREIQDRAATRAFTGLLPKVSPAVQIALVEALQQRGDPAASAALLDLARNADPAVRVAVIAALGPLGDAKAVPLLAEAAASTNEAEQKAARESLLQVRRGGATEALLAQLASTKPEVQVELVRALAGRAEKSTVPKLLEVAKSGADSARKASFRALGQLADASHAAPLVALVLDAKSETARTEAQEALSAVCQRFQGKDARLDLGPILKGLSAGSVEARAALLAVTPVLVDARIRAALRSAVKDSNPAIREAAIRALADTRDPKLMPDLLAVAREVTEVNVRTVALRGYVRLATEEENALSAGQRVNALKQALALATRPEEKQLVLSGLAGVPDPEALQVAVGLLEERAIQAEAAQAVTQIAGAIMGAHSDAATAALKKVLAVTTDPASRKAAESLLKKSEAMADFIVAWQVAGPYRQNGKNFDALFDTVFAPEAPDAKDVAWRLLPAGTNPQSPYLLDLLKLFGGEQCVAYARTRIYSEKEQPARLEMGSDDGVKVWLNGKLVHAHNIARPLAVGSDKAEVTLKPGWNTLLLKVTQNNLGWEFCARFAKPDGGRLEGLRFDTAFGGSAGTR